MIHIEMNDHIDEIMKDLLEREQLIYEAIGVKAEKYAKARCPVGTSESTGIKGYRGGTLRASIGHDASPDRVAIGTNVEYAPYVELGTGPFFQAPPAWEQFDVPAAKGTGHSYVRPRPFLRPALEDHMAEWEHIIKFYFLL